ncbi:ATP-binding protein [Fischerella thermalis]|uniref:ATP-binding response regulator n=1 Tax=Fischerella thermalis TaxID=372787 RepID=UPI000C80EDC3|nr:ATP-binding protein [Fischerella thermalis]PLZ21648.1 hybrid sensor histidine kinase/response regulator [Fischerella thermalis WC559]PLZ37025.1 hybrid sensor histidine kinase/response regulator [Fischerella thermalis WC542]PLZ70703.1 hybrid sensor histidine kinase/response regulator [Fischerella thermalis WC246]
MLKYPLYEFISTVPICSRTATLKVVLASFETEQCDRLVVLNEQQNPVGVIYSAHLLPEILVANQANSNQAGSFDLEQTLTSWGANLIQPIQNLPSDWGVEEFSYLLRSQQNKNNINRDWALIDSEGKFLGLIDSSRLLQFVVRQRTQTQPQIENTTKKAKSRRRKTSVVAKSTKEEKQATLGTSPSPNHPLIQLLERLPWPLMLQTNTGKIVTQNPAWWQQLGVLKDPEGVRQQVEAILNPATLKNLENRTHQGLSNSSITNHTHHYQPQPVAAKTLIRDDMSTSSEVLLPTATSQYSELPTSLKQPTQLSSKVNRCFLDSRHGTCTCVVEIQNGQERVWQFAKIPLDSPELKVKNPGSDTAVNSDLWLMLATDVTEQQQLCKELAAKNADLMQLNRLKDEFLACISHELKTPLTAVLGLSRLLIDQQLGELNERQARYAGLIHQSGRHLMSVVNNILDLTRMETGQMELMLAIVNIRTVCDRAISEAKAIHAQSRKTVVSSHPQTGGEEHKFSLFIEPGLEEIVADEFRLRQMLVHLLSNAFKFTETGGEIGLRVSRWEGWITFTVWDTGIGIPEHQQHLIFQKFQQLEHPLTRQFEGTGLGLVLTRALARLHGGDVSFLSREGKGSQFTLLLPPSPPKEVGRLGNEEMGKKMMGRKISPYPTTIPLHQPSHHHLTPSLQEQQGRRQTSTVHHSSSSQQLVLVVEAVARYIEDLTEQLTGLGYRVVIARSGCEAVEKARRLQPKAVFLNPLLPLLSGWDVLTLLKSDATTRHIPVIVTATAAEKEQAFANRADGFLSLPVEPQFLAPLLESLYTISQKKQHNKEAKATAIHTPLRILRLVHPERDTLDLYPLLLQHRIIEVDDIEQAELLARVWQFDVVLLDAEVPAAAAYLQKLSNFPRLATLPLVTCDVKTTQIASQIPGLSVFPCLMRSPTNNNDNSKKIDALLSVLQIAVGISCPPSILVVELAGLPDLPDAKRKHSSRKSLEKDSQTADFPQQGLKPLTISRGSEWFQALIQYLHTAGLKATIGRSWEELLQQLRHESVDLLLICLEESSLKKEVYSALKVLGELPVKLPPVLVLDQQLNPDLAQEHSLDNAVGAIATKVLPRSISMEDLLNHINQALATNE